MMTESVHGTDLRIPNNETTSKGSRWLGPYSDYRKGLTIQAKTTTCISSSSSFDLLAARSTDLIASLFFEVEGTLIRRECNGSFKTSAETHSIQAVQS